MSHIQKYHNYNFGTLTQLSGDQMAILVRHLNAPQTASATILGGRSRPVGIDLIGYGPVIIKKYLRGGLIRYLNRHTHVRSRSFRPQTEFERLNRVREIGVNAPEPVAYVTQGKRLYQGWLITREIVNSRSLAELCQLDPPRAKATLGDLMRQVTVLIDHHILHTDLHPGNVLVDQAGMSYIIDFDKTRIDIHNRKKLRHHYRKRWHRAIIKYRLPEWLDAAMIDCL